MATYYVELNGGEIAPKTELAGGSMKPSVSFSGAEIYPVGGGGGSAILQTKSVSYTPTESAISDTVNPDPGYDGLSEVNVAVGAISSNYVGSGIARKTSSDLTASGATVTAPAGYYENNATKTVASGSVVVDDESITISSPFSFDASTGKISSHILNSYTATATVTDGYVSSATSGNIHVYTNKEQQLDTVGATTYHPSTSDQTIATQKYLTGAQTIKGVTYSGLDAGNIKKDVVVKIGDSADDDRIVSVTGTYEGTGGGTTKVLINESVITSDTASVVIDNITYDNLLITTTGLKTAKTSSMGALIYVTGSIAGRKGCTMYAGNVFASIGTNHSGWCRIEDLGNGYKLALRTDSPVLPENNMTIRYLGFGSQQAQSPYQMGNITKIEITPSDSNYPFTAGTIRVYGW